jgi:hypothetical protein
MIFESMVLSPQTVHLSCVKIGTISKRTKMSFYLSLVTMEYHQVRPKQFLSLWYVWRKPCTYLTLTLTPSPNVLKRNSRWPTSSKSSIGCVKNNFRAYGTFDANCATIFVSRLALPLNRPKWASSWATSPRCTSGPSKMISVPMVCLAQTIHLSCTDTTPPPNGPKWDST